MGALFQNPCQVEVKDETMDGEGILMKYYHQIDFHRRFSTECSSELQKLIYVNIGTLL